MNVDEARILMLMNSSGVCRATLFIVLQECFIN